MRNIDEDTITPAVLARHAGAPDEPFHVDGAPYYELGADVAHGAKGEPCWVAGRVRSADGALVAGAEVQVWQADADGFYVVQHREHDQNHRARGVLNTDGEGRFRFKSIVAEPYPIPHDGPVGRMLERLGRQPWRPAHLHFMITAPGYERLITQVFREGGEYLDSDAVFGVRSSLITDWVVHPPGLAPDGSHCSTSFYTLDYDFVLNPRR